MRAPRMIRDRNGVVLVERFTPVRRAEHILLMASFLVLALTGFPQKYAEAAWSAWLLGVFGGLDTTRFIHRVSGLVFTVHSLTHILAFVVGTLTKRMRLTMLPTAQDLRDAWQNLRYYLGYRSHPPDLPKFDYRNKFEYIGIVLGGLVMITSGLALMYPTLVVPLLPGEFIAAARVAHTNEALLAMLVLVVWHVYAAHLSPAIFPLDRSIFTGYIPLEELRERHQREYRLLFPNGTAESVVRAPGPRE